MLLGTAYGVTEPREPRIKQSSIESTPGLFGPLLPSHSPALKMVAKPFIMYVPLLNSSSRLSSSNLPRTKRRGEGDPQMKERFGEMAMSITVLAAVLVVVLMAGISGCSAQTALALEGDDDGREITLQKGQILTIKLEGNPTTGYSWEIVESEGAILRQIGEPEFEAESDLLGAPGTQTLRFEAVETGQMELKLVYQRPWETAVQPLETFTVQVTVQ